MVLIFILPYGGTFISMVHSFSVPSVSGCHSRLCPSFYSVLLAWLYWLTLFCTPIGQSDALLTNHNNIYSRSVKEYSVAEWGKWKGLAKYHCLGDRWILRIHWDGSKSVPWIHLSVAQGGLWSGVSRTETCLPWLTGLWAYMAEDGGL